MKCSLETAFLNNVANIWKKRDEKKVRGIIVKQSKILLDKYPYSQSVTLFLIVRHVRDIPESNMGRRMDQKIQSSVQSLAAMSPCRKQMRQHRPCATLSHAWGWFKSRCTEDWGRVDDSLEFASSSWHFKTQNKVQNWS